MTLSAATKDALGPVHLVFPSEMNTLATPRLALAWTAGLFGGAGAAFVLGLALAFLLWPEGLRLAPGALQTTVVALVVVANVIASAIAFVLGHERQQIARARLAAEARTIAYGDLVEAGLVTLVVRRLDGSVVPAGPR